MTSTLVMLGCILSLFLGFDNIIRSLSISYLIFILNPVLFDNPINAEVSFLRFLHINICFIFVAIYMIRKRHYQRINLIFWMYFIALLCISIVSSYALSVSLFKIISFFTGTYVCLNVFNIASKTKEYWLDWFYSLLSTIVIFSIPVLAFPSIGYARFGGRQELFQGIANHPQAFSVMLAFTLAYLFGKIFERSLKLSDYLILAGSIVLMYLSRGRTGLVSIVLGCILLLGGSLLNENVRIYIRRWIGDIRTRVVIFVLATIFIVGNSIFIPVIKDFIYKRGSVDSLWEAFEVSRMHQVLRMLDNIVQNPVSGIGFGLPSFSGSLDRIIVRDPVWGLPISAPTEKGFLPIAVIEETGLIGFFMLTVFIFYILVLILRRNRYKPSVVWMSFTALSVNIGEMIFFSFGGLGLMMWLLLGLSIKK